ncbi:hypothetical protein PT276_10430 [Orbaceae bacterium ESL0721]|nr:hypothetical protein [Orbaceae bacterium ESL0721]
MQLALSGNIAGGLAGASAPYIATVIKEQTSYIDKDGNKQTDKEANLIAHAILGAAVEVLMSSRNRTQLTLAIRNWAWRCWR